MAPPTAIPAMAPVASCVPLEVFLLLEDDVIDELPLGELLAEEGLSDIVVSIPEDVGVEFALLVEDPVIMPLDAMVVASPTWLIC